MIWNEHMFSRQFLVQDTPVWSRLSALICFYAVANNLVKLSEASAARAESTNLVVSEVRSRAQSSRRVWLETRPVVKTCGCCWQCSADDLDRRQPGCIRSSFDEGARPELSKRRVPAEGLQHVQKVCPPRKLAAEYAAQHGDLARQDASMCELDGSRGLQTAFSLQDQT